ncbi:YifB family Mg chelatase-like AAA ATPase [Corynebacterium anserum]|nr:YifB family Mg chelatase-like AAA ATPase [Corynebacterium anserum]
MALEGLEGLVVRVECDVALGLPGISVIGMGDAAVVQARDRVRAALTNSGLQWPGQRVVMSLSPAGVPKAGAGYDLAMVCAMLVARNKSPVAQECVKDTVLVGELGLDGRLRPVPGILPIIVAAGSRGLKRALIPADNAVEGVQAAGLTDGVDVLVAENLREVVDWMSNDRKLLTAAEYVELADLGGATGAGMDAPSRGGGFHATMDFADVVSQPEARKAVEVAAAGGHALMLSGPPGTGKSMLAQRLPQLLPPMGQEELVEAAAIHSVSGMRGDLESIFRGQRPFVAPHHTVTVAGLIGGGARPLPGAISLAHHGVLFLDEVAEISRPVLDSLRAPMETRRVELVRNKRSVMYPAQFQLVCAANPCPCGAETDVDCTCRSGDRARYQARLSGPLRDRIDVFARTRSNRLALLTNEKEETTATVRQRVLQAHDRARARWSGVDKDQGSNCSWLNATVPGKTLRRDYPAEESGMLILQDLLRSGRLSQRSVDRALRVSWTLCDLRDAAIPSTEDVLDAVDMFSDEL